MVIVGGEATFWCRRLFVGVGGVDQADELVAHRRIQRAATGELPELAHSSTKARAQAEATPGGRQPRQTEALVQPRVNFPGGSVDAPMLLRRGRRHSASRTDQERTVRERDRPTVQAAWCGGETKTA